MNRIISSLLLILCAYLIVSCSKSNFECSSANTVNIPQVMKDYFYYKEGSWWVYKNIKNNTYDSMWVFQSTFNSYRGEGKEGFGLTNKCYEQARSAIRTITNVDLMSFRISNVVTDERERFRFSIFWRDPFNGLEKDFNLFFTNGTLEKIDLARPIIITTLDTLIVQNNSYNGLIEVDASSFFYDNIKYRLFAKNIGLVKYIDRDSNHWELIRYNINQ